MFNFLKNIAPRTGINIIDTNNEIKIEAATASENGRKNSPIIPPTNTIGKNTTIVTSVDDETALITCLVACNAISF